MDIRGQCQLPAPPEAVWHMLAAPEHISQCVPGLARWEALDSCSQFQLWLRFPVSSAVQPLLPMTLTWVAQQPPTFLRLALAVPLGGQEIPGLVNLTLHPLSPAQTTLDFHITVTTTNRFVQQIVRQQLPPLIDTFFVAMRRQLLR